uniref:CCT domain-containing protein n=1 Tax=Eucampia antarctica TaxID=49252 RepID=A0A7S2WG87_9STRA|mmetsp:Transcript_29360/g.28230  ORF Transcript_29360/g.28230 Transcript_29360/m.28230 type:complete len:391 (+) Transcript_29360:213-1385(+)|eukprot:CAMPEP_0197826970 /NCGR_PEP_ID=MMETSP1437-20131217/3849_1 /TAXON_ID=49252 ORGANISM="Eucampia antarctica, Strain CCMP1452" /NCGR_SAMPLE_ID=MMETSP1437 /ASSEMBLY_ACC=CAM_ASM_001096 /LENGTH=390 /DNA_ID=CAMNT_0043427641 /DNA_START=213 /DNA_END=1385 /DNA_ORIENTATION=+
MAVFTLTSSLSSSTSTTATSTTTPCMNRLDAAQALLGVSPTTRSLPSVPRSNRFDASALDALASLASSALNLPNNQFGGRQRNAMMVSSSSFSLSSPYSSSDEDSMPPPPPRLLHNPRKGRLRSASNPEGMEKWDSFYAANRSSRLHFVLPNSILEEELTSAREACHQAAATTYPQDAPSCQNIYPPPSPMILGTSPTTVVFSSLPMMTTKKKDKNSMEATTAPNTPEDESGLQPEELLRRARSRLLEDLSTEAGLQKGVLPLPHSLAKYSDIYNKNGRIGIYTPCERGAIIARFNEKRSRRVWNKKIRYNCRKSLADRRMRVKGRFVKRCVEQEATSTSTHHSKTTTPLSTVQEEEEVDTDMPDINDLEANFQPTDDQPFRRPRRYTIT